MNSSTIFLQEKIQHNDLTVNLYILRLPTQLQEHQQLIETVKRNSIKVIFYFGTSSLVLKNQSGIKIQQVIQDEKALQSMQVELINNKSNIGLMCTETCETSLQMYFHYMVKIEKKNLSYFENHAQWHVCPIDQLRQLYEEIHKSQNINIFDYNLLKTNSNIGSKLSNDFVQSEIITKELPRDEQCRCESYINNSQVASQKFSKILPEEDQVISELYPMKTPSLSCSKMAVNPDPNPVEKVVQPQHLLKFDDQYQLPNSITFIHFIPQDGFRCLE
ncbi:unnamed protein product (macronuclear) [Paramecium tetraurelia]|uniref:Uncharacterized protein n=1 Tax=Paramecium tetraurelia TaxID=5888 RepID=A0BMR4_PARTE|nr:uncharacterized protein GSPATT00030467001 [Paramecium tetraurelia]CAK59831.1 unnamed protein product [Paramecium tetraurelia]|eukprot:XP_001427229.1 hypothetical protein (macronuclear) [Paramecium tetraurelia strain d4-2]